MMRTIKQHKYFDFQAFVYLRQMVQQRNSARALQEPQRLIGGTTCETEGTMTQGKCCENNHKYAGSIMKISRQVTRGRDKGETTTT